MSLWTCVDASLPCIFDQLGSSMPPATRVSDLPLTYPWLTPSLCTKCREPRSRRQLYASKTGAAKLGGIQRSRASDSPKICEQLAGLRLGTSSLEHEKYQTATAEDGRTSRSQRKKENSHRTGRKYPKNKINQPARLRKNTKNQTASEETQGLPPTGGAGLGDLRSVAT